MGVEKAVQQQQGCRADVLSPSAGSRLKLNTVVNSERPIYGPAIELGHYHNGTSTGTSMDEHTLRPALAGNTPPRLYRHL